MLVAFVVLALLMLVLQRGAVGNVEAGLRARDRIEATRVAQTLLTSPTLARTGRPASGRMNARDWTVRFEPIPLAAGSVGRTGTNFFRPMQMIVSVSMSYGMGAPLVAEQVQSVRLAAEPNR